MAPVNLLATDTYRTAIEEAEVEQTLTCREVMSWLRCSRKTVHEMLEQKELHGFKRGRLIRVSRKSVEELLGITESKPTAEPDTA